MSRSRDSVIWTLNDSGNEGVIYALNFSGELLAAYEVRGAENRDWEDLATGPCLEEAAPSSCLYIADTGDNNGTRESVRIYVIPEPVVAPEQGPAVRQTHQRAREIRVRYPGGHPDVEAMAVEPDGTVLLVTKGRRGNVQVYRIRRSEMTDGSVTATLAGTIGFAPQRALGRTPTGAAVAPRGDRLVIRTYTELFFYRLLDDGGLELEGEPCFIGPIEPQGEGVDFLDERAVLLTSEARVGRPGTIYRVLCTAPGGGKPR